MSERDRVGLEWTELHRAEHSPINVIMDSSRGFTFGPNLDNYLGTDHYLHLVSSDAAPSGWATPREIRLQLSRKDDVADTFAYVHETHHVSLNDSTAWGSLLHLVSEAPRVFTVELRTLVDACRLTHEVYATFAGMSIVEARFGEQSELLDPWPKYREWWNWMTQVVDGCGGPQRQYLLATAMARASMQLPLGDILTDRGPEMFRLSDLRSIDRPDTRFRILMTAGHVLAEAATLADEAAPTAHEVDLVNAEPSVVTADSLDAAWASWETAVYKVLASHLRSLGANVLSYNGHQDLTQPLIDIVRRAGGDVRLSGAPAGQPVQSDAEIASSQLVQIHEDLVAQRYRARVLEVDPGDLPDILEKHSRVGGHSVFVVTVRLPERLERAYRWEDDQGVQEAQTPLMGVRLIEVVEGESQIVWIPMTIDDLREAADEWGERGPLVAVVAASCFADTSWQLEVFPEILELMEVAVLVDVPPDRLVASWTAGGRTIRYADINVEDPSGTWRALAFVQGEESLLWFVLGHAITVGLFRQGFGYGAHSDLNVASTWKQTLEIVLTATLAEETVLDFGGVEERT